MNSRRILPILAAYVTLGLAAHGAGLGQAAQSSQKPGSVAAKRDDNPPWTIVFLGGVEHSDKTKKGQAKNVTATSDEGTVILTDLWQWDEKAKTATATGNMKMTDPQADATSERADVYYKKDTRRLVLTGSVVILVKPKQDNQAGPAAQVAPKGPAPVVLQDGKLVAQTGPRTVANQPDEESPRSARKYPATITCDKVEYEYARDKKHAVLTGNFKVVQKLSDSTRTLTAEHGEWFGNDERIVLYPPVHFEDTKGRKGDTESKVTIHTREGEETFSVPGKGVLVLPNLPDEDEPETPADRKTEPTDKPKKTGP
jgi:lipopolysaccharide export system protein LptA